MSLSWNEIRSRSIAFSKEWADEYSENSEAKSFWDGFFEVFGVSRRRRASFESHVKKIDNNNGFIDLLWKGVMLVEHKSRGGNLDRAHSQALDYFSGLKDQDLPRYIVVSDFARFRLYDLDEDSQHEFCLEDLHKNINHFGFVLGHQTSALRDEDPVNINAAEAMGKLHDQMKEAGYEGHALEVYLVRLLFCMFSEDTGIFERREFQDYIENKTTEDGADLASHLNTLFQVLNTPQEKRLKNRDEDLTAFPYVNGKLFKEMLPTAGFDKEMRQLLIDCCALDWSGISPAIFGSLFQTIMDKKKRRELGAHYTSEKNILKLINPLFMDDLRVEFEKVKANKKKLLEFHIKLRSLTFFDPACGCGNFLVIAYREMRLLELDVIRTLNKGKGGQLSFDVHSMVKLDVDQFYGIEIEEFSAQIAQVALWLVDHQMNLLVSQEFGEYFTRIPLKSGAQIIQGNALRIDWEKLIDPEKLSFIIGNPPFKGKQEMDDSDKNDLLSLLTATKVRQLDYVCGWYIKAAKIMAKQPKIMAAFVSTNSITQGEQPAILWGLLKSTNIHIFFAHRTFSWRNEAKGNASVHCVIIGFTSSKIDNCRLWDYGDIKGEASEIKCKQINAYLIDADPILIERRRIPISDSADIVFGSMANDGGNLFLTSDERNELIKKDPSTKEYIRRFLGAREFLNNQERYCLWLKDCSPHDLNKMKDIKSRVGKVQQYRLSSKRAATKRLAGQASLFGEIRQPISSYLLVPRHSSERRTYIPIGYVLPSVICGDANLLIPNASKYEFGILMSTMHMAWTDTICGRIKNDYRYSAEVVYNNFPWPSPVSAKQKQNVELKAQAVLSARDLYPDSTLADLYDPLIMPPLLLKAHKSLDSAVDQTYRKKKFKTDLERVVFLFDLHQKFTSLLP